jgi:phosphatidate phosphatase LPIN
MWDYTTKIVISDIDGTVTKSDVGGHVMPRFGKDWSHESICELY